MSKKKNPPEDRAVATIRKPKRSDAQKGVGDAGVLQTMQSSSLWAAASGLQAAAKPWSATADALDANVKALENLREQVSAALANQVTLRRDWEIEALAVTTAATMLADGSADSLAGLGLDVLSHARIGALGAPLNLVAHAGKASGEWVAAWTRGNACHGFLVQHATDPSNPTTVSLPTACTKATFKLGGFTPGQSVSVRLAAIDPSSSTGQSPWTAWVAGTAR